MARATATAIVLATLVACGGGGGNPGGSGGPAIEVPFSSFAAITANQTVVMDSTAVTASGTQMTIGGNTTIRSATLNPVAAATVRLGYDGARALKSIGITTPLSPQTSVSFDRDTPGHSVSCSGGVCGADNPTALALAMDAFALGWNYQSLGVWLGDLSPTSWVAGAVSAGHPTTGNAVPTSESAVFSGFAAGFYFDSVGTPFATVAGMNANVNFSGRSIAFSTSDTTLVNANDGAVKTDRDLDLIGTFGYTQGINAFSGTLNTANSQLTGQGSGRFYGPAAEEIGGVYSLSGLGLSRMIGGFGGKSGGGGGPTAIEVPFTSFAAVMANQTVVMDSTAVTASGNQLTMGDNTTITSATFNPVAPAAVRLGYDGARALKSIGITTPLSPQTSVSFDRDTPGHSVSCSGGVCGADNPTASAIAMDAFALGWNYQSFGVWGIDLSPTSWVLGAVSAGKPTTGNAVPTIGNAVFTGLAAGFYFDSVGTPFATAAGMSANVNFTGRSIAFSTSNTTLINTNTGAQSTDAGLNLTGALSYAQGVNAFSGTLNTANSQLTGQGSGRFYGPAAEEIGGVYSLSGSGLSRMVGGFGGKR